MPVSFYNAKGRAHTEQYMTFLVKNDRVLFSIPATMGALASYNLLHFYIPLLYFPSHCLIYSAQSYELSQSPEDIQPVLCRAVEADRQYHLSL